jgi:hypothetical protein
VVPFYVLPDHLFSNITVCTRLVMMGWDWCLRTAASRAYCSLPGDCNVDHGMVVSTLNSSTRVLWQPPVLSGDPVSRDISGASRKMGEGNENLVYPSPWYFKRFLTFRKILRHGAFGFTSHPKEVVLRIFIAFKNPSPRPGSNPRPLLLVVSTLTTTPSRRHYVY